MKGKVDGDAVTKFALNHAEKLVLGLMIGIFVFLVFRGLSIEPYSDSKTPPDLTKTATNVMSDLKSDHWSKIKDEEIRKIRLEGEPTFADDVVDSRNPIDPGTKFPVVGVPPLKAKTKRRAPAIDAPEYAPQQVRVAAVLGAFNVKGRKGPYSALEDAPPIKVEEEDSKKKKRPKGGRKRGGPRKDDLAILDGGLPPERAMMIGGPRGAGSTTRKLNPKYNLGLGSETGQALGRRNIGGPRSSGSVPFPYHFIAGTAVMPHEALFNEFEEALAKASAYNPSRDRPIYIAFRVIRADVTGRTAEQLEVPDNAKIEKGEGDWVVTTQNTFIITKYIRQWAAPLPPEVIAPPFYDRVLTLPIPPLLMQNYFPLISHSAVPFVWDKKEPTGPVESDVDEPEIIKPGSGMLLDPNALKSAARGQGKKAGGNQDIGGGQYGEQYGSYGGDSYGMSEMGSGFGGDSTIVVPSAKFKMIRFYDFRDNPKENPYAPQPGRDYVYCISVAIADPNYPVDARMAPPLKTLDDEALKLVQGKIAEDVETSKKLGRPYRKGYEWSAWSKPSPPVRLPEVEWFAGGPTYRPELSTMQGKTFQKTEPEADIVAVNWDWGYATELTADFQKAKLGTVLDRQSFPDDIVNPLTLEIKRRENASVKTGGVLVGIEGSHPLGIIGDDGEPIPAPGATLIIDDDGSLSVHGEVEDAFMYRRYTFADEREVMMKAKSAESNNMMEFEMLETGGFSFE